MSGDLQPWALPRLQRLLPIDDGSLKEIITYTSSLPKAAAADHLKNLLGDSPQALEFISSFNARRANISSDPAPSSVSRGEDGFPPPKKKSTKKSKPPLHSTGPARRPEGYGNVAGGYKKHYEDDSHSSTQRPTSRDHSAALLSETPEAWQAPFLTESQTAGLPSGDVSPAKPSQKLPPSASGQLISDFGFANVRAKQSKRPVHATHPQPQSGTSTPNKAGATTTTSSVADLTAAIAALELATNPTLSTKRRKCDCNASIHPLFTTAPNCLNCGKIICALEGLQPCSFCDTPLLTKDQVNDMIKALKEERGIEKMAAHNAAQAQSGRGTPVFGGSTPDSASGDELSSAASRARAHRDKLLAFQRDNAQRTRVYDEAADYDMSLTPGATQWMSPVQRAAALKKQQKYLRELEEASRPEWEKKRTVMSMSIKNGKLVKTYGHGKVPTAAEKDESAAPTDDEDEGDSQDQHLSLGGKDAFSNNPLLATGKLIRPVWKAPEGSEKGKSADTDGQVPRKSVWRRVQDDNVDNEHWILDGGLHGSGTESTT
ncbi:hypothetical protein A1O3_07203 [Capronia epimyces CBS 606.96]|uniref:TRIP4/RQT4 C2HC5-type zinc finger domain-containing protein n=1 Tax=Capronia epimyces CBS 606.96 TaxID=1182542 RepID=W9XUB4_9EURO|nr:uncharacterized protein A1O3_07203 [Capronia epimyces CBS 606.96]EXJ80915.1 hypothetical protein A1O3_07203 [Capronia epimyces CBS 606.96]